MLISEARQPASLEQIRVSAIVPNYNHGDVLPEAVAALQAQTVPPWEIIIVDDGSTDNSRTVISALAAADPHIKVVLHRERQGAIAALNTGIKGATGRYLYLGAADDVTMPTLFERLGSLLVNDPRLGLVSAEVRLVERGRATSLRPAARPSHVERAFTAAETAKLFMRIDNFLMTGAALLDRNALVAAGGLRRELGSFADGFAVRQLAFRHGFAFLPEVLAEWRVSDTGLSRKTAANPSEVARLLETVSSAFEADPAFPLDYPSRFARRWRFGVLRLALADAASNRALIFAVAPGPYNLRRAFAALALLPLAGRPIALVWATLAYRPFSLVAMLHTALRRRWLERGSQKV